MDANNLNWILAIACLLAGIGLGVLGYHLLNSSATSLQKLRQRLAERDRELAALRSGVDEHLDETSRLLALLQHNGEALAERLAQATDSLGSKPATRPDLELAISPASQTAASSMDIPAPRDYADGSGGTLSEDFGLKDGKNDSAPQPPRY